MFESDLVSDAPSSLPTFSLLASKYLSQWLSKASDLFFSYKVLAIWTFISSSVANGWLSLVLSIFNFDLVSFQVGVPSP